MKSHQATIKDIARLLNISSSTVSRALKDYPGISQETKDKVKKLAAELHYRPNAVALSLRKQRSMIIGVVIPEVVHFFFSTIIGGIEEVAQAHGYTVILCQTNEKFEREKTALQTLLSNQVDGLLVSYSKETENFAHFTALQQEGVPLVFFDRIPPLSDVMGVTVNDYLGARQATEHLIQQGFKAIAHLSGPKNLSLSQERIRGYQDALSGHQQAYNRVVACPEGTLEEAQKITQKLLQEVDPPDAIFASNDLAAAGAMQAVLDRGLDVPKDFGLVGFSNWQFSGLIRPSLSTIEQHGKQIGTEAMSLLLKSMQKQPIDSPNLVLETTLIARNSSKRTES
ncbi:MAG: LacI family DNA-binding transcriptional regulator [Nitritalea sp.]